MTTSFQANAVIGGLASLFSPTVGMVIAVNGLGLTGIGIVVTSEGEEAGTLGIMLGLILLEEDSKQILKFKEIDTADLQTMGLNNEEQDAYNYYSEELTLVFNMIADESMSEQEARDTWEEQEEQLGSNAINGLRKVLKFSIQ